MVYDVKRLSTHKWPLMARAFNSPQQQSVTRLHLTTGTRLLSTVLMGSIATVASLAGFQLADPATSRLAAQESTDSGSLVSIDELKKEFASIKPLYDDQEFAKAAQIVDRCNSAIQQLMEKANSKDSSELLKILKRLDAVHELLAIEGASMAPIPTPKEVLANRSNRTPNARRTQNENRGVSFATEIAPWLVEKCSGCHIQRSEGNFSLSNFAALSRGVDGNVVIFPGDPVASRLVEVIESGDMPRGGQKVPAEELTKLKEWIQQGAQFDGPGPAVPMQEIALAAAAMKNAAGRGVESNNMANNASTRNAARNRNGNQNRNMRGKEEVASGSVSFSKEVAPLLTANCNGCHLDGNRTQGGLSMNTFADLMRGGGSGSMIKVGAGEESLLVKKLRGTAGQRMPAGGRPALADKDIETISKWITEGAKLDGENPNQRLAQIISEAWVAGASESELREKRIENAKAKWQVVAPGSVPEEATSEHFHVLGNVGPAATKAILEAADAAEKQIKKLFSVRSKDPLIKGGVVIFAFKQRYDYSEFGTMLERRSLPVEWSGHWRSELLDSYVTLVYDPTNTKINESSLVQQLTSLWIGSQDGVPRWFAEGAGRQALASSVNANDARVQGWTKRAPESFKLVTNLKVFTDGAINDEDYATIGYALVKSINDSAGRKQYDSLIRALAGGTTFDQAMLKHFMPANNFLQQTLGSPR